MFVNKQRQSATKQANRICNIRNSQVVEVSTVDLISSVRSLETKGNQLQQRQARGLFEETLSPLDIEHRTGLIGFDLPGEFTNPEENRLRNRQPSAEKATVWLKAKAEPMKTWHQASPCQGPELARCRAYYEPMTAQ